jgi:hypothetical protein
MQQGNEDEAPGGFASWLVLPDAPSFLPKFRREGYFGGRGPLVRHGIQVDEQIGKEACAKSLRRSVRLVSGLVVLSCGDSPVEPTGTHGIHLTKPVTSTLEVAGASSTGAHTPHRSWRSLRVS